MRKLPKKSSINWYGTSITIFKLGLLAELAFVSGTYYIWSKMNSSRDFRFKMYNSYPSLLKGYYWSGETMGSLETKKADYEIWGIQDSS